MQRGVLSGRRRPRRTYKFRTDRSAQIATEQTKGYLPGRPNHVLFPLVFASFGLLAFSPHPR